MCFRKEFVRVRRNDLFSALAASFVRYDENFFPEDFRRRMKLVMNDVDPVFKLPMIISTGNSVKKKDGTRIMSVSEVLGILFQLDSIKRFTISHRDYQSGTRHTIDSAKLRKMIVNTKEILLATCEKFKEKPKNID